MKLRWKRCDGQFCRGRFRVGLGELLSFASLDLNVLRYCYGKTSRKFNNYNDKKFNKSLKTSLRYEKLNFS